MLELRNSLRNGTFFLACIALLSNSLETFYCLYSIANRPEDFGGIEYLLREIYYSIESSVGIIISTFALIGIQKNRTNYLDYFFCYLCYEVFVNVFGLLIIIVSPSMYIYFSPFASLYLHRRPPAFIMIANGLNVIILSIENFTGLLVVVKCYRYVMRNNIQCAGAERYNVA